MKLSTALGGVAGACALTLINYAIQKIDKKAPRLDLLRMNVLAKVAKSRLPVFNRIFPLALSGDIVSNALYYTMAKGKTRQQTLLRGAILGLGAGIGAVAVTTLPLGNPPAHRRAGEKLFTVTWYVIGGLVAASVINLLEGKEEDQLRPTGSRGTDKRLWTEASVVV